MAQFSSDADEYGVEGIQFEIEGFLMLSFFPSYFLGFCIGIEGKYCRYFSDIGIEGKYCRCFSDIGIEGKYCRCFSGRVRKTLPSAGDQT